MTGDLTRTARFPSVPSAGQVAEARDGMSMSCESNEVPSDDGTSEQNHSSSDEVPQSADAKAHAS